jgi:hypothetical protein
MMAAATYGESTSWTTQRTVTVCMERSSVSPVIIIKAQDLTSKIFAEIGVNLQWHRELEYCDTQGILIRLSMNTSKALEPGAFAYAQPYKGTVRVFYDRISQSCEDQIPNVLGHVLAHEITHDLQGFPRHSDRGIMKAHWDLQDFKNMREKPLKFEDVDIELILGPVIATPLAVQSVFPHRWD